MSHKYEVTLDDETQKAVKKMAERGVGKGRGERTPVTIGEMCSALVRTGAFRRIAANKWAKAHPAKPAKKVASKKQASKKPAAKKSPAKASKKPAKVSKPKAAKKAPAPAPAAQSEGMKPSLPAAGGVLD